MLGILSRLWKDEEGASLIEYVLIAGLISIIGFVALQGIGVDLNAILTKTNTATTTANAAIP